jgi:CubicO group peptidase (beta-lactamase class C family)
MTFGLCSVGKQFTGAGILRLHEQGKLNLDDDICKFIPEMPVYNAKRPIRIIDVARMCSGLPDEVMYTKPLKQKNPNYLTNEDFAGEFARLKDKFPLIYPTGHHMQYSNTGYMVLGLILERASGKSYKQFMIEEFFKPLGMKTAWVHYSPTPPPFDTAYCYLRDKDVFRFSSGPASVTHDTLMCVGHAGVCASLDDMERWDAGWREHKIITEETQRKFLVPSKTDDGNINGYAFGWCVDVDEGGQLTWMEHSGNYAGFNARIARDVINQRTVVILCNMDEVDQGAITRILPLMPPKRQQK